MNTIQDLQRNNIPVSEKYGLTIREASEYFGIGEKKMREISANENCPFVIWIGSKRIIKRKECEKYLSERYSL